MERSDVSEMSSSDSAPFDYQRVLIDACLRHRVPFFWRGPGTMLISIKGASPVLRDVTARGYPMLGVEGFELDGTVIHPRLDLIFDAESRPDVSDPVAVLAGWPDDVWIDVVVGPRAEHKTP